MMPTGTTAAPSTDAVSFQGLRGRCSCPQNLKARRSSRRQHISRNRRQRILGFLPRRSSRSRPPRLSRSRQSRSSRSLPQRDLRYRQSRISHSRPQRRPHTPHTPHALHIPHITHITHSTHSSFQFSRLSFPHQPSQRLCRSSSRVLITLTTSCSEHAGTGSPELLSRRWSLKGVYTSLAPSGGSANPVHCLVRPSILVSFSLCQDPDVQEVLRWRREARKTRSTGQLNKEGLAS